MLIKYDLSTANHFFFSFWEIISVHLVQLTSTRPFFLDALLVVFLPYFTVMSSMDCFHRIPESSALLMLECFLTRMFTYIVDTFFDINLCYSSFREKKIFVTLSVFFLCYGGRVIAIFSPMILRRINPLTICSVDVSGRREMREFFNGIVRLQVSATLSAMISEQL